MSVLSCLLSEHQLELEAWVTGALFERTPSPTIRKNMKNVHKGQVWPAGCGLTIGPGAINHPLFPIEVSEWDRDGWLGKPASPGWILS